MKPYILVKATRNHCMKCIFAWIMCVFLSAISAEARLGETLAQCKVRYGEPKSITDSIISGYKDYVFEKNGIRILVTFMNGKGE